MDVEKTIREYLPPVIHLSLATTSAGKPWVCEVHYAYDDDLNLYFRSLASRRHSREIAANPNVAGNIVQQYALEDDVVGVYFEGTAARLSAGDEQDTAFDCITTRFGGDESIREQAQSEDGLQFYKIAVDNWFAFGLFGAPVRQKHVLEWKGGKR